MNWPLPQDFNEAVQNPATAFDDPDLKAGQTIVGPTGLPLPRSGNFADVYQIRGADGRHWAVKCFTRPVTGLEHRYKKVEDALQQAGLSFTVDFTFLNRGILVHGKSLPAVKMEWVDGLQLNQVVRNQAGNPKRLDALGLMWSRLSKKLRDAGIAHADLQHGNVLLTAGSKPGSYGLKLIDYDGMYVPALANAPSGESGHPNFQHPARAEKRVYSQDLDRFPHLVIATALKGLAVLGPKLWEDHDTGDNLLFTEEDFRKPAASSLMMQLWHSNSPELQALVGHLAIACGKPIPQTPWLDQIATDGAPLPLSAQQAKAAAIALGVASAVPVSVAPVSRSEELLEEVVVVEDWTRSPVEPPVLRNRLPPADELEHERDVRILRDDIVHGPYTREEIRDMLASNQEQFADMEKWCRLSVLNGPWLRVSEYLLGVGHRTTPQPPPSLPPPARPMPARTAPPEEIEYDSWGGDESEDSDASLLERRFRSKKEAKAKRSLFRKILFVSVLLILCIVAWSAACARSAKPPAVPTKSK